MSIKIYRRLDSVEDKVPGVCIQIRDVPEAYWALNKRAWDMGLDWASYRAPKSYYRATYDGAASRPWRSTNRIVWIPAHFIEPESNELGEVSP